MSQQQMTEEERDDAQMDLAVKHLLKVWPYAKPYGLLAVEITKRVATEFDVEWDELALQFNEAFVWPTKEEEANMPSNDHALTFGPMTSDILGECSTKMFMALCRLLHEWPHQEMFGKDCPIAVQNVATRFGVDKVQLYHLFATNWFEYIEAMALNAAQAQRVAEQNMGSAIQELVTVWGPEYSMSRDDLITVKRIARNHGVNWALLYGEYVEEDHAQCQEAEV